MLLPSREVIIKQMKHILNLSLALYLQWSSVLRTYVISLKRRVTFWYNLELVSPKLIVRWFELVLKTKVKPVRAISNMRQTERYFLANKQTNYLIFTQHGPVLVLVKMQNKHCLNIGWEILKSKKRLKFTSWIWG